MAGVKLEPLLKTYNPFAKGYYVAADGRRGVKANGMVIWVSPHSTFGFVEVGATREPGDATFRLFREEQGGCGRRTKQQGRAA